MLREEEEAGVSQLLSSATESVERNTGLDWRITSSTVTVQFTDCLVCRSCLVRSLSLSLSLSLLLSQPPELSSLSWYKTQNMGEHYVTINVFRCLFISLTSLTIISRFSVTVSVSHLNIYISFTKVI